MKEIIENDIERRRTADSVERIIRIEAPVDAVWAALTDPEELTNWFPLDARVDPGEGGVIHARWSDDTWFDERIDVWKTNEHLRTVGVDGGWAGIATDYRLGPDGAATVLRVVSSGFGPDEDWQEMLDAFGGGWDFELRGLRHYLERHAGTPRRVFQASVRHAGDRGAVWNKLTGPDGWLAVETAPTEDEGAMRFAAHTSTDDILTGTMYQFDPPGQIVAAVGEFNDAFFRLQVLPESIGSAATLWISTYGADGEECEAVRRSWQTWLDAHIAG
ncbi:MAG: SRPBCC domain-containing protein [Rhodothermales bacterium]|nr:SRPBCC domain-containing protein [Rhodothermales bacterium]